MANVRNLTRQVTMSRSFIVSCIFTLVAASLGIASGASAATNTYGPTPQTVYFPSADGRTDIVGYLLAPAGGGRHPAIVLLHGRAGPYSSNVNAQCTTVGRGVSSPCNASTLSKRHKMWTEYWVQRGYVVLLVDSFGPRGRAHGYGRGTHDDADREDVNERTVRPLDAEGALAFLVARNDVQPNRVMLQGWSNGGSTTLNVMYRQAESKSAAVRFRGALAFYPGCGPRALLSQHYRTDTELWVFVGSDDEEVSPKICADVMKRASGGPVNLIWYDGATHDFDDPGTSRQSVPANRAAQADALRQAGALLENLR
jgi:carboxymethylenebutenolidase